MKRTGSPTCKDQVAGTNFWAFAGQARPVAPGQFWQPGAPFLGDPPHEQQGWYSVYDSDVSTLAIVHQFSRRMSDLDRDPHRR
jgi:mannan endo-1,4-beta-mannosidase